MPSGATVVPTPPATVKVPAATDWLAASKIVAIELAFLGSVTVILLNAAHGIPATADALTIAATTGATLGILRIADVVSNVLNVRQYLNSPTAQNAGVVPQASGTPLVTTVPQPPAAETGSAP